MKETNLIALCKQLKRNDLNGVYAPLISFVEGHVSCTQGSQDTQEATEDVEIYIPSPETAEAPQEQLNVSDSVDIEIEVGNKEVEPTEERVIKKPRARKTK